MWGQTIGKQALPELRKGWRFTPTSGIWQSVWLEPVGEVSIERLKVTPDSDNGRVIVQVYPQGELKDFTFHVAIKDGGRVVASGKGTAGQDAIALRHEQNK